MITLACNTPGLIEAVIGAMSAHCDNTDKPDLFVWGCGALFALAVDNANVAVPIVLAGGLDVIARIMRGYKYESVLQWATARVLATLPKHSPPVSLAMRDGPLISLLNTAMDLHNRSEPIGVDSVRMWGGGTLISLVRMVIDAYICKHCVACERVS